MIKTLVVLDKEIMKVVNSCVFLLMNDLRIDGWRRSFKYRSVIEGNT